MNFHRKNILSSFFNIFYRKDIIYPFIIYCSYFGTLRTWDNHLATLRKTEFSFKQCQMRIFGYQRGRGLIWCLWVNLQLALKLYWVNILRSLTSLVKKDKFSFKKTPKSSCYTTGRPIAFLASEPCSSNCQYTHY